MNGLKLQFNFAVPARDKNGKIWMYDNNYHALLSTASDLGILRLCEKYDFSTKETQFVCKAVFAVDDDVYIVGNDGGMIIRHNIMECKNFIYHNLLLEGSKQYSAYSFYKWENRIVGIPIEFNKHVMVFDIYSRKFMYINCFMNLGIDGIVKKQAGFAHQEQQYIYIPIKNTGNIVKFDLSTLECEVIDCGNMFHITTCCTSEGEIFFAVSSSDQIYKIDKNGETRKLAGGEKKYEKDQFSTLIPLDDFLIALPRFRDNIVIYNRSRDEARSISVPGVEKYMDPNIDSSMCCEYIITDNSINTLPWVYPNMLRINPMKKEILILKPVVSYDDFCEITNCKTIYESKNMSLYDFIDSFGINDNSVS